MAQRQIDHRYVIKLFLLPPTSFMYMNKGGQLYQDTIQSVQTDSRQYSMRSGGWCKMDKHKKYICWSGIAGLLELANTDIVSGDVYCGVHKKGRYIQFATYIKVLFFTRKKGYSISSWEVLVQIA